MKNFLKKILKVYSVINLFKSKLILISFITILSVILELIGLGIFIPIIDFLSNDKGLIGYHYIPDEIRLASKRTILLISIIIILIVFTFKASINIFLSFLQAKLQSDIDINEHEYQLPSHTPLYIASSKGHGDIVAFLLNCDGIDVNAGRRYTCNHCGLWTYSDTPMRAAYVNGHTAIVKLLKNEGGHYYS